MANSKASVPLVTAPPGPLPLLYRDEVLVVVNKPSGLSSHRGMANEHGDYVLTRVRDQVGKRVYLVHRLDRATSGALALVLDPKWVEPLQRAFEEHRVEKRYLAFVRGVIPERVECDHPLPRGESKRGDRVPAFTTFVRLGVYADRYSLVEALPRTGRYHQIRRHLAHLRHPIIGDTTHGDGKENRFFRERFRLMRLCLHAHVLGLPHPVTGAELKFQAPLPDDLATAFQEMGFTF